MITALLSSFGVDLLSAASCDLFSQKLLTKVHRQERALSKQLHGYLARSTKLEIEPGLLAKVVFKAEVWTALLRGDPGTSTWEMLLGDLLPPSPIIRYEDLAAVVSKGIRTVASRDIQIVMEELRSLRDLTSMAKDTQSALFELQAAFRSSLTPPTGAEQIARTVSESVRRGLAELNLAIQDLTAEQFDIIKSLHGVRRALIPGSAGSGKTIAAVEKAVRLDEAGIRTLLLCHNPFLAEFLERLTAGTSVDVLSFSGLVETLTQRGVQISPTPDWTYFEEPSDDHLLAALDAATEKEGIWDAIVVDEAQDFRRDWWDVVEACFRAAPGILYVFADDDQRMLAAGDYPPAEEIQPMVRNCRNSGSVYNAMRLLVPGLARPEELLTGGSFDLYLTDPGQLLDGLPNVASQLNGLAVDERLVVLVMPGRAAQVLEAYEELPTTPAMEWRTPVVSEFERLFQHLPSLSLFKGRRQYDQTRYALIATLTEDLSYSLHPTEEDVDLVQSIAEQIQRWFPHVDWRLPMEPVRFLADGNQVRLNPLRSGPSLFPRIQFFASRVWPNTIPRGEMIQLRAPGAWVSDPRSPAAEVFEIAQFKGLEAESVVVLWEPQRSPFPRVDLYVAISRARYRVSVLAPTTCRNDLPARFFAGATPL